MTFLFAAAWGSAMAQERPLKESQATEQLFIEKLAPRAGESVSPSDQSKDGGEDRGGFILLKPKPQRAQSIMMTFQTGSAELLPATKKVLDALARALMSDKLQNVDMIIEGHADPRGDAPTNLKLSQERAQSVVTYLVDQHNISKQRLQAVGKGSSEPINRSDPSASENRRVNFVASPR